MATAASQQTAAAACWFSRNEAMSNDEKTAKTSEMHTGSSIQAAQSMEEYSAIKHITRVYTKK